MKLASLFAPLLCFVSAFALDNATFEKNRQEVRKYFPSTTEEVKIYANQALNYCQMSIQKLTDLPVEQKNFDNTILAWNQLCSQMFIQFGTLRHMNMVYSDPDLAKESIKGIVRIGKYFAESISKNTHLQKSLMSYAERALKNKEPLKPFERYLLTSFLQTCESTGCFISEEDRAQLKTATEGTPFTYLRGKGTEKKQWSYTKEKSFTVLTHNTCLLPGVFPLLFGGVSPWEKRIAALGEKIHSIDADVVCLQEVFTEEAGIALYAKLKDRYTHFYIAIGPKKFGFNINTLGLPSGLFVASKYEIENPSYAVFPEYEYRPAYGFFDFVIKNQGKGLAHIYNTHLQALDNEDIRVKQIEQIMNKMREDYLKTKYKQMPFFLCGDLNVPWGSNEPAEKVIRMYFEDAYNKNRKEVRENERTCTNFYTNYFFAPSRNLSDVRYDSEILDYALLLQKLPAPAPALSSGNAKIETKLIIMNDDNKPMKALSDHHGLLTTIRVQN